MTIAHYHPNPTSPSLSLSTLEIKDRVLELAEVIANTEFVPRGLRGNPPAILAAILYGHEVGIGPMQSLSNIAVIDGRPTMSVNAMRGLILAEGHELLTEESTVTRAVVAGRRRDSRQTVRVTWTIDDARRAKLAGRANWTNYPRQMLVARATAELARGLFADVIGGFSAPEEVEDAEPDLDMLKNARPEDFKSQKPGTKRRSRAPVVPAAPPAPEPPPLPDDDPGQLGVASFHPGEQGPAPEPPPLPDDRPATPDEVATYWAAPEEAPAPPPDPPRISDAMRRKMHASFREAGIDGRNDRLAYIARIIGREIESSTQLAEAEVSAVISALAVEQQAAADPGPPEIEEMAEAAFRAPPASSTQKDRLDRLTHELLAAGAVQIADLWEQVAVYRKQPMTALIPELGGYVDGRLQWQPLRESLSVAEASDLIGHLEEVRRASSLFDE